MNIIQRLLLCRCGHKRSAHQHYRKGSDCALCDCARWSLLRQPPRGSRSNAT